MAITQEFFVGGGGCCCGCCCCCGVTNRATNACFGWLVDCDMLAKRTPRMLIVPPWKPAGRSIDCAPLTFCSSTVVGWLVVDDVVDDDVVVVVPTLRPAMADRGS